MRITPTAGGSDLSTRPRPALFSFLRAGDGPDRRFLLDYVIAFDCVRWRASPGLARTRNPKPQRRTAANKREPQIKVVFAAPTEMILLTEVQRILLMWRNSNVAGVAFQRILFPHKPSSQSNVLSPMQWQPRRSVHGLPHGGH